jgi:AraC family transcriptional regulator
MANHIQYRTLVTHADPGNGDNRIVFSRYKNLQSSGPSKGHSLKYVHRGEEVYQLGHKELAIREGQFFMVNNHEEVSVRIKASQTVEGLCLFLSDEMLSEIYSHGKEKEEHLLAQGHIPALPRIPGFFAQRHDSRFSPLGAYVREIAQQYQGLSLDADLSDKTTLYRLGKLILEHHQLLQKQLDDLPARKRSTREELYRRLHIGRHYLIDNWNLTPKVPEAAREAALSEYHFYRLFRQAFGQSPLQFLNQYRLEKAQELLQKQNLSITEVAEACGFYDVQHFNKAYRKYFSRRPSHSRQ